MLKVEHIAKTAAPEKTAPDVVIAEGTSGLILLRFTEDAPRFATEFGEFDIRKEDVAYLPSAYSKVLIGRKVAIELHGSG